MLRNTVLVGIVGTVMGVGGIVYGLPPEVLDQDPVASLPEADAVPPADAAAPTLIPVDFDFDPETLRVKVGSGLDQRLFQAAAGDLMTILPRGRAAGPALTSLAPDDQRRVRDEHGAQAEEWFATRFAEAAKSVLDRWRLDRPELRYSVVGVPIEGRGEQAETLNRHLAPLVESLDAIVSSKFLMVNADADPGQSALKSSMRNGAALAQGRPVYFRTPSGWSRFVPDDRAEDRNDAIVDDAAKIVHGDTASVDRVGDGWLAEELLGSNAGPEGVAETGLEASAVEGAMPQTWHGPPAVAMEAADETPSEADSVAAVANERVRATAAPAGRTGSTATVFYSSPFQQTSPLEALLSANGADLTSIIEELSRSAREGNFSSATQATPSSSSRGGSSSSSLASPSGVGRSSASTSSGGGSTSQGASSGGGSGSTSSGRSSATSSPASSASSSSIVIPLQAPGTSPTGQGSAPSGSNSPSATTPSIPSSSGTGGTAGSTAGAAPAAPLPPPSGPSIPTTNWNPSSGVSATTPVTAPGGSSGAGVAASVTPLHFGENGSVDLLAQWACDPFRVSDGRLFVGVRAYASEGIESVRFLVSGLGASVVNSSVFHGDRGMSAYWISIPPANVVGSSVTITAIVHPSSSSAPLESMPITVSKRGAQWDVPTFKQGWTALIPSSDSRLIYVSNDGDDTAAKAVKGGRGYYLPSDPEIGPDPLNPVGPIVSYSNPVEAYRKVRGIGWSHETADFKDVYSRTNRETLQSVSEGGWPDWLLFRRGNTFGRVEDPDLGNVNVGDMFQNAIASYMTWSYNPLAENANRYEGGGISGRSVSEPFVVAAWGPPAEARPVFHGGFTVNGRLRDAVISSIDCQPTSDPRYPGNRFGLAFGNPGESAYGAWRNVLVEDCRSQGHGMIAMSGGGPSTNLTIRRSTWTDGWQDGSHNSSPFNGLADGARLTYEECVFDKNGYKENPADATKWTGELSSALAPGGINGTIEPGQGVQATRTWFDRNWYMSGSAGDTLVLRGNIAARTGGGAEQMRSGGVSERNLFLFNHDGVLMGAPDDDYGVHDTLMKQNVFLHDDVFLPPGGWGMNNFSQGGRVAVVDNVFAHPHRGANGPGWMYFYQARNYESSARALIDNAYYARIGRGFTTHRSGESLDHPSLTIVGNEIAIGSILGSGFGAISRTAKSSSDTVDGNLYWGDPSASRFTAGYGGHPQNLVSTNRTFLQWQADGYDTGSQMIADWSSFKSAAGWSAPERDIVSYMQSIDPTYVPNEDVRVDYGCAVGRANAPLVRTVVLGTGFGQIAEDANARLAARRFHAAITFLNRARENRRGNWDDRYTADAVNDYIRQGFGKPRVRVGVN